MRVVSQGPVIKLGQPGNAALDAGAYGRGPEHATLPKLHFALTALCHESLRLCLRGARKEKKLVKIALTSQFGFARRQTRVLNKLASRKRAQSHDGHFHIPRKSFHCIGGSRQGFCEWDASKPAQTHRCNLACARVAGIRAQMKIAFGEVNATSVL